MRDIWIKILQTGGAKLYATIVSLGSLVLTARLLGPEGRGQLVAVTTWAQVFADFAFLSLGQVAIFESSKKRDDGWYIEAYRTLTISGISLSISAICIGVALYFTTNDIYGGVDTKILLLGIPLIPILVWKKYSVALLQATEKLRIFNKFQVLGSSLGIILVVFALLSFDYGVEAVLICNLIAQLFAAFGGLVFLHKKANGLKFPKFSTFLYYFKNGLKIHANTVGMFFVTGADILMINSFRNSEETAFYQLGIKILSVFMLVPLAANMVVTGKISRFGPNAYWSEHLRVIFQVMLCMLLIGLFAFQTAEYWIPFVAGSEFTETVSVFQCLLLALPGMTLSILMAPQWIGRGYFVQSSMLTLMVGFVNLGVNWILIPRFGMFGAVVGTIITYTFSLFCHICMIFHCNKVSKDSSNV